MLFSEENLNQAFQWLRKARKNYSPHDDCWFFSLRFSKHIKQMMKIGYKHRFSPQTVYIGKHGLMSRLCAKDALIQRAMAQVITKKIHAQQLTEITHLKGHGGVLQSVRECQEKLGSYAWVLKSDVQSFYESINHDVLIQRLWDFGLDKRMVSLCRQAIQRVETFGGLFCSITQGLAKSSPLSVPLSTIMLMPLDRVSKKYGYYRRYMDDWVLLCHDRKSLKMAVKRTHDVLDALDLKMHPDKTYIGQTQRGFDFLGWHISPYCRVPSTQAVRRHASRLEKRLLMGESESCLALARKRHWAWVNGALGGWEIKKSLPHET